MFCKTSRHCTQKNFKGGTIWCYSEKTVVPYEQLAELEKNVLFHEGVPKNFNNAQGEPCLILDDLLNEVYSEEVCILFTRGSHHWNISVILITQNLFHQGKRRDISLNAK
jgi:hypothetical protein